MIEKYKPFESAQFKKGRKHAKKQGLDAVLSIQLINQQLKNREEGYKSRVIRKSGTAGRGGGT